MIALRDNAANPRYLPPVEPARWVPLITESHA